MDKIRAGFKRVFSNIHATEPERFAQLASGQSPQALVIACSDSRVSPTLLTGAQLGELFIMRNAGNIIPAYNAGGEGEAATLEFAVAGLGVQDIIVLGHSKCGAMGGLMHPERCASLPAMRQWLRHCEAVRPAVQAREPKLEGDALLSAAAQENLLLQLEHLRTYPVVRAGLARKSLGLHAWYFDIERGAMLEFDEKKRQFVAAAA